MIKKILSLAVAVIAAFGTYAQAPSPLPLNPAVKHGTLPNGLNYYILHNEYPKERVNFYIAQKVGSTLETPEQLGLAHFLEHMAFNGTQHYPGKTMLEYLQSKGIRFGADINAYTSFDETVYNINNVPSTDAALVDSVLLVIHDWSGSLLLEDTEIDAERGVIEEEWRSRNNGQQRMWEAMLPAIYKEYQYKQMPIGKMEVVKNFPPQVLRDYYHKWYRPDQQGIVIVGDVDAEAMEKKVIDLFSSIPMPENAAPRTYPEVSDNQDPIFFYFNDKELQRPMVIVSFKSDKIPFEMRNTDMGYIQTNVIEQLISMMINNRLDDYSQKPECKYANAEVDFGDFFVSKTKAAFNIYIIPKEEVMPAYEEALAIVAQACKAGFMESELVRARDELLALYEKSYNERNNTSNDALGRELYRHFIDNEPAPGIEMKYQLMQGLLQAIPLQVYNQLGNEILTAENEVICVSEPLRDKMTVITETDMVGALKAALNKQYEAFVDEVITDPLVENLPQPGSVTSQTEGAFGSTVLTLSNGAKVIVKTTDFKQDEILFAAFKEGGKNTYSYDDAPIVISIDDVYDNSKLGKFDRIKLGKYLAGKNVELDYTIGNKVTVFDGKTTVKDLPTLMELVYSSFTDLNADTEAFDAYKAKVIPLLRNMQENPQYLFQKGVNEAKYGDNPFFAVATPEAVESYDYQKGLDIYHNSVANAADYTFTFTGNVNLETLKPLLEQYIATIPSTGVKNPAPAKVSVTDILDGVRENNFTTPMQVPSTMVYVDASGTNLPYSIENDVKVTLVGNILSNVFTDTLREEEGGTYSPHAQAFMSPWTGRWELLYVFQTNSDIQDKLIGRADEELQKLLKNGASEHHFNKAREAALKQLEIKERTNSYWSNNLLKQQFGIDDATTHRQAIETLTLSDFNLFMKDLYNGKNHVQVVMQGVPEAAK